jgi:UTP--glucose-1-phosphate uridylyltransferase
MAMTKAVIPAAGLGTRFLPATKAVPKELLPVVDTPAIEYVVAEAADAGLDDVLIITASGKDAIVDHFDTAPALEAALEAKGDVDRLAAVRRSTELATVHTVRQPNPRGLGHAVLCAKDHVGGDPFAVLLGDDLIDHRDKLLRAMVAAQRLLGGSVIALMRVPLEQIGLYGSAAVEPLAAGIAGEVGMAEGGLVRVTSLVEKPSPAEAPSDLAVIGRYVLHPAVFGVLERTPPGRGGEIQLTDAIGTLAALPADQGGGVHGVVFDGRRYDTGDRLDYLKAVVRLAVDRPDLGPEFRAWLKEFVG